MSSKYNEYSNVPFVVKEPESDFADVLFDELIPQIESEFDMTQDDKFSFDVLNDVEEYHKSYKFMMHTEQSYFEEAFQNRGLIFKISANVKDSGAIILFLQAVSFSEDEVNEDVAASVYEVIFNIIRDEFDYTEVSKNSFLSHDVECISASEDEDPEPEFVMPNKEEE